MTEETSPLTARLLDEDPDYPAGNEAFLPNAKGAEDASVVESLPEAETSWERGEKQPPAFRDWPFGILFHIQFITIIALGGVYTNSFTKPQNQNYFGNEYDPNDDEDDYNLMSLILPVLISAGTALLLILLALVVLTRMGKSFITCSIWTNAIVSFMVGITALSTGLVFLGCFSLLGALVGCCYAVAVRNRIPFAAANLNAGVSSIKSNAGITLIVLLFGGLIFGWMLLWIISLLGVVDLQVVCDEGDYGGDENCQMQAQHGGWTVLWVLLLFWTQQVFKNVIHTTVAGVVGTWFFDPQDANSFCSTALGMSLFRSLTYSFGSICFGSLFVAILQTLDWIVNILRNQREQNGDDNLAVSMLLCCLDCLLSLLEGIMEYFNKWAFVYVGVYGYPYFTAGKKVMTLFAERGWTVVINDNLISNALSLMCFVIALLSGITPLVFTVAEEDVYQPAIFVIGFMIALLLSITVMSIIDSAVSTIIVCFAEAPEELERNHSAHSRNMREAWNKVYQIGF